MTKLSKLIDVNVLTLGFHGKMTNPDLPVAEAEHLPGSEVVLVLVDEPELDELVPDELDESPEELDEVPEDDEETTEASDEPDDVPDELLDEASDELVPDDEDELVPEVPDDDELEEESEVPVEAESEEVAVPVASCLAILQ